MTNTKQAEGFAIIPNWVVRETNLSAYALLVYLALTGRANADGECWPSLKTIAKESRCSVSTARRAIQELVGLGVVSIRSRRRASDGAQTSNVYKVNIGHHPRTPVSDSKGPRFVETPQEEDTREEDENKMLKPTLWSGRHSDDSFASDAQIAFLRDCHILLHDEVPDRTEMREYEQMSSALAHENIRQFWSEIEHGNDALLSEALDNHHEHLSNRALQYIDKRLEI
jgi:DNA-binding transcriptional MocR family regulator